MTLKFVRQEKIVILKKSPVPVANALNGRFVRRKYEYFHKPEYGIFRTRLDLEDPIGDRSRWDHFLG